MNHAPKIIAFVVFAFVVILIGVLVSYGSFGTVESGTYIIKQSVSGSLSAIMKPGIYIKGFGTITEWPIGETFYFTADNEGSPGSVSSAPSGSTTDDSIEVRFNDGAICRISGTCRVDMPRTEQEAIDLVTKFGYRSHQQVEQKLILPVIRRALIMTANLMSSKESYSDRRADFFKYAWDQIANGVYQTKDEQTTEVDPITGEKITKVRKTILIDERGHVQRELNPLEGTGITMSIFEIKNFVYEDKVQKQISTQQDAIMAVQTARANAQKAVQDALTAEANGKAAVMKAQYEEMEKKARAEVAAQQQASVAVIAAQQQVDVASKTREAAVIAATQEKDVAAVALEAARLQKQKQIELATGESEARKMILASDGALIQKLDAYNKAQAVWADAFARRQVPSMIFGGAGGAGSTTDAQTFMELMTAKAARDLSLDMSIRGQAAPAK